MNWRKITFVIAALIILLGGSAALSWLFVSMKQDPPRRPDKDRLRLVKTEVVKYEDLSSPLTALGRVVSENEVMLVSETSGKIEKGAVNLKKGTSFKKGQLLAFIYKDEVELALKARKSNFLNLLTNILPDLKVDFPEQYNEYLKFFNSINLNNALPALPAANNDKLKIFLASRNILSDYYGIKQDEKKLSRHSMYAPFSGTFIQVNSEVGAYVNAGAQIAKMISTDQLEIETPVENIHSKWIKLGDKVKVSSKTRENVMQGTVVRKADFVDANTQSRSIFIRVDNSKDDELLAGEYKLIEFPGQIIPSVMEIPRSAIFNSNEVFAVVDGKLKKQEIDIVKTNEKTLIFKGIESGLRIVTEPLINVKENTQVGILGEEQTVKKANKEQKTKAGGN